MTRHRILLTTGIVSLIFAALPWVGFGCCAFSIPGINARVPRLSLMSEGSIPCGRQLYGVMEMPLWHLGRIPPLGDLVFFSGEGVVRIRPFMVFVFWLIVGILTTWIAVRPTIMPRIYGHLRRKAKTNIVG